MSSSIIQVLMQLVQCNRRAPSTAASAQKERDVKFRHEPTKACKDGGLGELSTSDVSDECSQGQTDSSSDVMDGPNSPQSDFKAPPGLTAPPGLDAPMAQSPESTRFQYWDRVVSRQPQQMTRHEELRTSQCAEMARGSRRPPAPDQPGLRPRRVQRPSNDPLVALKEALAKLAPAEVATVRSLLDSKIRDAGVRDNSQHAPHPFTPFGVNAKPSKNRRGAAKPDEMKEDAGDSLRSFLHELTLIDNARVLSVRKINLLGFGSAPLLQTYFSAFGTVERVMVAPTVVKCKAGPLGTQKSRARPAGLGFVVMSTSAEAQAVLNHGEAHTVGGVEIGALPFQSHSIDGN